MVRIGAADRTQHIAATLLKIGAALEDVFHYYKFDRHGNTFAGKPYFLLSHCARLLSSLLAEEDNLGAALRHTSGPAGFLTGLDLGLLRPADDDGWTAHADSDGRYLPNEARWFESWMQILERFDSREASGCREFSGRVLTCVRHRGFLAGKAVRKDKKALNQFLKTYATGRVMLYTMSILEDVIRAMVCRCAALDPKIYTVGHVAALICLLKQIRRTIVCEAVAKGPCASRGARRWRKPLPLSPLCWRIPPGLLTVVPRREGGGIVCSYSWESDGADNTLSWIARMSALKNPYEQELFATWSPQTGEYLRAPHRFPDMRAFWIVQNAEARHLENMSLQVDIILETLRANPACRNLVAAVRPVLRNGAPRWKSVELPWTYVGQLDQLLERLTSICREASTLKGDNPVEQLISRTWPVTQVSADDPSSHAQADFQGKVVSGASIPSDLTPASGAPITAPPRDEEGPIDRQPPGPQSPQPPVEVRRLQDDGSEDSARSVEDFDPTRSDAAGPRAEPPRVPIELPEGCPHEQRIAVEVVPDSQQRCAVDCEAPAPDKDDSPDVDPRGEACPQRCCASGSSSELSQLDPAAVMVCVQPAEPAADQLSRENLAEARRTGPGEVLVAAVPEDFVPGVGNPLLERLLEHHRSLGAAAAHEPLSATQLQCDLGWNRSRVQRAMGEIFGTRPFHVYRTRCIDQSIIDFLTQRVATKQGTNYGRVADPPLHGVSIVVPGMP